MVRKENSPQAGKIQVTFEFPAAGWTKQVHLVGDFNGWNEQATPMARTANNGVWRVSLELRRGTEFQFRYLVNQSEWHNDWHADKYVPNVHGSDNSVVCT